MYPPKILTWVSLIGPALCNGSYVQTVEQRTTVYNYSCTGSASTCERRLPDHQQK